LTDQTLGGFEQIPEADAQADLLEHLVGVFLVDIIFNGLRTRFYKIGRRYLNHIRDGRLQVLDVPGFARSDLTYEYKHGGFLNVARQSIV
jgi:hypothetical protein